MSKVIWFIGSQNDDFSDRAIQASVKEMLQEQSNEELQFVYFDCNKTWFSEQLIDKMNNEADLLFISCEISSVFSAEAYFGVRFGIDKQDIPKINIPIVVYGMEHNAALNKTNDVRDTNVLYLAEHGAKIFVCSQDTYDLLAKILPSMNNVFVAPSSCMFLKASNIDIASENLNIGINWDTSDELFLNKLELCFTTINKIVDGHNAKIYIIDHVVEEKNIILTRLHEEAEKIFEDKVCIVSRQFAKDLYPPADYNAGVLAAIYGKMDFVIGMQPQANIIAFGQKIPYICIGDDETAVRFAENSGFGNLCVPLKNYDDAHIFKNINYAISEIIDELNAYKQKADYRRTEFAYIKETCINQILKLL